MGRDFRRINEDFVMESRKEAEAQFDAAGINLAGHEFHEIPDPNGDGVTRVWCKPGSMLKGIMEEVVADAAAGNKFQIASEETLGASSGHDPSFVSGWNAVANITCNEPEDFDPDMYQRGVTEAIAELRRRNAQRAEIRSAHQDDINAISEAWARLTAAGIEVESRWSRPDFRQEKGIPRVVGPEVDSGIPF